MKMSVSSPFRFTRPVSFFGRLVFFAFLLFLLAGSHLGRAEQAETPPRTISPIQVSPIPVSPIPVSPIPASPFIPESGKGSSPEDRSVSELIAASKALYEKIADLSGQSIRTETATKEESHIDESPADEAPQV